MWTGAGIGLTEAIVWLLRLQRITVVVAGESGVVDGQRGDSARTN